MSRQKDSGSMGPTRSVRLPRALDAWFEERLARHDERSASEVLVSLVHGGLRLREGYMATHRRVLERYIRDDETATYAAYCRCLVDTFGLDYVNHLERWLEADDLRIETSFSKSANRSTVRRTIEPLAFDSLFSQSSRQLIVALSERPLRAATCKANDENT